MAEIRANTDSLTIDESDWSLTTDTAQRKIWIRDINGDKYSTIMLLSFNIGAVDFGVPLSDIDSAREIIRRHCTSSGAGLISADVVLVDGFPSLRIIQKELQQPIGMTYLATLMVQCRGCFFNILIKSFEIENPGMREAIVLDRHWQREEKTDSDTGMPDGWFQDPYNPYAKDKVMRNPSDDETYDLEFPNHPLSRVRRYCHELAAKATIDKTLQPGWSEDDAWWKRRFAEGLNWRRRVK